MMVTNNLLTSYNPPPQKKIYIENNTQLKTFPSYSVIESIGVLTYFYIVMCRSKFTPQWNLFRLIMGDSVIPDLNKPISCNLININLMKHKTCTVISHKDIKK